MKPYTTQATDQPHSNTHRQTPLDFTALWMRVVAAVLVIVACIAVVLFADLPGPLDEAVNTLAAVVVVVAAVYAGVLALYARLQHFTAYGRQEQAQAVKPGGVVYFTQRMNVAGEQVDRDAAPVDFGVKPDVLKRVMSYISGGGATSRSAMTKGLGISQGQWSQIMAGLEDIGAVSNNGRAGIDADMTEISRLLKELDAQGW